jgi:hypothetical protein
MLVVDGRPAAYVADEDGIPAPRHAARCAYHLGSGLLADTRRPVAPPNGSVSASISPVSRPCRGRPRRLLPTPARLPLASRRISPPTHRWFWSHPWPTTISSTCVGASTRPARL